jgi:hypothetical protein
VTLITAETSLFEYACGHRWECSFPPARHKVSNMNNEIRELRVDELDLVSGSKDLID